MCCIVYHGKPVKVSSANNLKSIRAPPMPRDLCFVERSKPISCFSQICSSDQQKTWKRDFVRSSVFVQLLVFPNLCLVWSAENTETQKTRPATLGRTIPKQITRRSSDGWSNLCGSRFQISKIGAKSGDFVSVLCNNKFQWLLLCLFCIWDPGMHLWDFKRARLCFPVESTMWTPHLGLHRW